MKLTKLSLANFKSFSNEQTIEFSPVTLLFGPNSVGKSTVLMALFYLQQILEEGDCNPMRLKPLGDKYVGGFKGLVHGRDLSKTIKIRVDYDKVNSIGSTYNEIRELIEYEGLSEFESLNELAIQLYNLPDVSGTIQTVGIEFAIEWSTELNDAYVSECHLFLDGSEFALLGSQPDSKQTFINAINYLHPLLIDDEQDAWLEESFGAIHPKNAKRSFLINKEIRFSDAEIEAANDPEGLVRNMVDDTAFASPFHEMLNEGRIPLTFGERSSYLSSIDGSKFVHSPIAYENMHGALPNLGRSLVTTLDFDTPLLGALINELLSDAIVPAFDNLLTLLKDSLCIGPLRHIPDAEYQPSTNPRQAEWYDGKACWDTLAKNNFALAAEVNQWLSTTDKLDLGYKLAYEITNSENTLFEATNDVTSLDDISALVEAADGLSMTLSKENLDENPDAEQTQIPTETLKKLEVGDATQSKMFLTSHESKSRKFTLWDEQNNIAVSASDIGVGVSQLLPLVVAALSNRRGLVACEQPELHVHPRVQVAIGDLLTQTENQASFLIETHSEHLILRLLKRIRQTSEGELPEDLLPVTPEDVSIVYLKPSEEGVKADRIHVDEEGEFKKKWPSGFFAERSEELF